MFHSKKKSLTVETIFLPSMANLQLALLAPGRLPSSLPQVAHLRHLGHQVP